MAIHGVDQPRIVEIVDTINASLTQSIPESVKQEFLIEPFTGL